MSLYICIVLVASVSMFATIEAAGCVGSTASMGFVPSLCSSTSNSSHIDSGLLFTILGSLNVNIPTFLQSYITQMGVTDQILSMCTAPLSNVDFSYYDPCPIENGLTVRLAADLCMSNVGNLGMACTYRRLPSFSTSLTTKTEEEWMIAFRSQNMNLNYVLNTPFVLPNISNILISIMSNMTNVNFPEEFNALEQYASGTFTGVVFAGQLSLPSYSGLPFIVNVSGAFAPNSLHLFGNVSGTITLLPGVVWLDGMGGYVDVPIGSQTEDNTYGLAGNIHIGNLPLDVSVTVQNARSTFTIVGYANASALRIAAIDLTLGDIWLNLTVVRVGTPDVSICQSSGMNAVECASTMVNANRSFSGVIAATSTFFGQSMSASISISKQGQSIGMLLSLLGAKSDVMGSGLSVSAMVQRIFGIDISTFTTIPLLGPFVQKFVGMTIRNINITVPFFGLYESSPSVFEADVDFSDKTIPLRLVRRKKLQSASFKPNHRTMQDSNYINGFRLLFQPLQLLAEFPALSWAAPLLGTVESVIFLGDAGPLSKIGQKVLPFTFNLTAGGGVVAVLDLQNSTEFLGMISDITNIRHAVIVSTANMTSSDLDFAISLTFDQADIKLGFLNSMEVFLRKPSTASCLTAGFMANMTLSVFGLVSQPGPIVTVEGFHNCVEQTLDFSFRLGKWTRPFGISFLTLYEVSFTASLDLASRRIEKIEFMGSLELGNSGVEHHAYGVFLPRPPATYGFVVGKPDPISYVNMQMLVTDMMNVDLPSWMDSILNFIVLQNVSFSVFVPGNFSQYTFAEGVTLKPGVFADVGRFCLLWGAVCGSGRFALFEGDKGDRTLVSAQMEDFSLFRVIEITGVSVDWVYSPTEFLLHFRGSSSIFWGKATTAIALDIDGGLFNLTFQINLFDLIGFEVVASSNMAIGSGADCPNSASSCVLPAKDIAFNVIKSEQLQSFLDSLSSDLSGTLKSTFQYILDNFAGARTVLNAILDVLRPIAKILGVSLPTLGGRTKRMPLQSGATGIAASLDYVIGALNQTRTLADLRAAIANAFVALNDEQAVQRQVTKAVVDATTFSERKTLLLSLAVNNIPYAFAATILNDIPPADVSGYVTAALNSMTEDQVSQLVDQAVKMCEDSERNQMGLLVLNAMSESSLLVALEGMNTTLTTALANDAPATGILYNAAKNSTIEELRTNLLELYGSGASAQIDQAIGSLDLDLMTNGVMLLNTENCSTYIDLYKSNASSCASDGLTACYAMAHAHVMYVTCLNRQDTVRAAMADMVNKAIQTVGLAAVTKYQVKWFWNKVVDFFQKVATTVVNGITYTVDFIKQKWDEWYSKLKEWTSQSLIVEAAKTLVGKLMNLQTSVFSLEYIRLSSDSLIDAISNGEITIEIKGKFFGIDCCSPLTIGVFSDLVTFGKTIFNNYLITPLKAVFGGSHAYLPQQQSIALINRNPIECFADWNIDSDHSVNSYVQAWEDYISAGCDGNCTAHTSPNMTEIVAQLRSPVSINQTWYLYDLVCDGYFELGRRVVTYSDGSVMGFDVRTGEPGNGPATSGATIVSVSYYRDTNASKFRPYNAAVDNTADLLQNASNYDRENAVARNYSGASVDTPSGAQTNSDAYSDFNQMNQNSQGTVTMESCAAYLCSLGSLLPNAATLQCQGACTDDVCCYDPLSQNCGSMLGEECPAGYAVKSSVTDMFSMACKTFRSCIQTCCQSNSCVDFGCSFGTRRKPNPALIKCSQYPCTSTECCSIVPTRCGDMVVDWRHGEQCEPPNYKCCDGKCHFRKKGTVCQLARSDCETPWTCSGTSARCLAGRFLKEGSPCVNTMPPYGVEKICRHGKCIAPARKCGNKVVDEDEDCEPPNQGCCDARCQLLTLDECRGGSKRPGPGPGQGYDDGVSLSHGHHRSRHHRPHYHVSVLSSSTSVTSFSEGYHHGDD